VLDFFLGQMREVLPKSGQALGFCRRDDASFTVAGDPAGKARDLIVAAGEGIVAAVAASQEPQFAIGKKSVLTALETFHPENVRILNALFDEHQLPGFAGFCPIVRSEAVIGVVALFLPSSAPDEMAEWERLLTLACGLYSLRLTVEDVRSSQGVAFPGDTGSVGSSSLINDVNNHLSAVIGTAGLALQMEHLSGDLKTELTSIIAEAEKAAGLLKKATGESAPAADVPAVAAESPNDVNSSIERVLQAARISGDLYMAGGRAREIMKRFGRVGNVAPATPVLSQFFETVLDRFAAAVSDDDMMTISTYEKDGYVYLDISRHRRNFPPVDHVSSFGDYELADLAIRARPADIFLNHIASERCYYAYDRISSTPAYLSFKFPIRQDSSSDSRPGSGTGMRILAIDDQAVILDLITAMCQSMGFQVETARTGEEGLRLAAKERFDLVLTDLAMPDISGLEVARRIHHHDSETTIVLITGWEAGFEPGQIQSTGISQVLYKPFRIEQLADIIRTTATRLST
jgi:CheY-like chemotaxis protein